MNARTRKIPISPSPLGQKGAALIVVLLLSMVSMTAGLMAARGAETELKIAHNDLLGRQALAIAEAGLNHAFVLIANDIADGLSDELTGTGGLATISIATENIGSDSYRFRAFGGDGTNDGYLVRVEDNRDEAAQATLDPDVDVDNRIRLIAIGRIGTAERRLEIELGPGPPPPMCAIVTQGNLQLTGSVKVTGAQGCVHTNSNLTITGSADLEQGATSSGTMEISGSPTVAGTKLETQAQKDAYELANQNRPPIIVPSVRPFFFGPGRIEMWKEVMNHPKGYRLDVDGNVYAGPGYVVNTAADASTRGVAGTDAHVWTCNEGSGTLGVAGYVAPNCHGGQSLGDGRGQDWNGYRHGTDSSTQPLAKWNAGTDSALDGVFFVEGHFTISGNPGSVSTPWRVTVISLNSVGMSGNPDMQPFQSTGNLRNILFISGNDVELNGNGGNDNEFDFNNAAIFAHQQIKLNGNPGLNGFIVAEDTDQDFRENFGPTLSRTWDGDPARHCHSKENYLCDEDGNSVSGSAKITFNTLDTPGFPNTLVRYSFQDVRR